jgi:hypothetical protein
MSEEPYPCELCGAPTQDPDSAYCDDCNIQDNLNYSIEHVLNVIESHVRLFKIDRTALLEGINKGGPHETPTT